MLVSNKAGNYSFLRGIAPYSAGAAADEGYEVVHARFPQPVKLEEGFRRVRTHLEAVGRPVQALCGMELRSPKPFSFKGFGEFNAGYIHVLEEWGVFVEGVNPVARTNVAPEVGAPAEPALYGFSYTAPARGAGRTFVVAGAGELPEGSLRPEDVVRKGDLSAGGLREKVRFVMGLMAGRLRGLGVDWKDVTVTEVYTVHPFHGLMESEIVRPLAEAAGHGVTWHYARPPIESIEFEMDMRGCRREIVI